MNGKDYYLRLNRLNEHKLNIRYMNFDRYSYFYKKNQVSFVNNIPLKIYSHNLQLYSVTIGNYLLHLISCHWENVTFRGNILKKIESNLNLIVQIIKTGSFESIVDNFSLKYTLGRLTDDKNVHKLDLGTNWESGLGYGVLLSAFSRIPSIFPEKYEVMKFCCEFIYKKLLKTRNEILGGLNIFEEYSFKGKDICILNGHLFSMFGIYDYYLAFKNDDSINVFKKCVKDLKTLLPMYDCGDGSYYDLTHIFMGTVPKKCRIQYHCTHIEQLKVMFLITGDPFFENYYKRFEKYLTGSQCCEN